MTFTDIKELSLRLADGEKLLQKDRGYHQVVQEMLGVQQPDLVF